LAGALPQTLLGELTVLSQTPSWINRSLLLRERGWEREGVEGGEAEGG